MKTVQQRIEESTARIRERLANGEDPRIVSREETKRSLQEIREDVSQLSNDELQEMLIMLTPSIN